MTFVVGAVGSDANALDLDLERGANRVLQARGDDDISMTAIGGGTLRVAFGVPGAQSPLVATAADQRFTVLFMGFTFSAGGDATTTAAALLAECVRRDGQVTPPKGHYLAIVLDHGQATLRAYVDHMATTPLYVHQWQGSTWFSSELKALLPLGRPVKHWNPEAIQQSYLLGFVLDEATVCREIDYIPGGTCLVIEPGCAARRERYHDFADSQAGQTDLPAFRAACATAIEGGVRNVQATFAGLGRAPLATVSGGLDSRAILAVLAAVGAEDLVTIGWGQPGSADADIGGEVARAVGARHLSRPYRGGAWLLDVMDGAVGDSECMCSFLDAARIHQLLAEGLPSDRGPLYTGLSGDMVMGSFINWRDLLRRRTSADLPGMARRIAVEYTNVSFHGLDAFARHLGGESVERTVAAVGRSLEASRRMGEGFYNHLDRWNLRNKQARGIFAYFRGAAAYIPVFSPFYDPDLIDCVRGLSVRHRFAEAAYVQYLVRHLFDRRLAALPWQKSATTLRGDLYGDVARTWSRKVIRKLGQFRSPPEDPFADPTNANPYNLWIERDEVLRERIRDGLSEQGVGALLQVEEGVLRRFLDDWIGEPAAYRAVNLNLIYMLSVVRFARLYGADLSTP